MDYGRLVRREGLWLSVLGPLRAWRDGDEINLGAPQQRALLAILLVRSGSPVMRDEIVDVLWPAGPPSTVTNVVQHYISQLRRLLPPGTLVRSPGGYLLDLGPESLDLIEFRGRVAEAAAIEHRDPARATDVLVDALRLWRAPVAANVDSTIRLAPMFAEIDNELVTVTLQATRLALGLGRAGQLLPILHAAAAAAPLNERLQAAIMEVLASTGSAAEALARFAAFRARLSDELGVEPGPQLMAAHRAILGGVPVEQEAAAEADLPPLAQPSGRLAQLPADLPTFAGRTESIERLSTFVRGGRGDGSASARVGAVTGLGGIGKTTLAVRCAHQLDADFPGGQLYVNMRGFDPSGVCVQPQDALRSFLAALGVPEKNQPHDLDAQVALYRSRMADQRIMVVIDNVRDSQHARPLLPGTPGCAAIVTSRDALTGLIVQEGALPVVLDLLSRAEAEVLLEQRIGAGRVAAERPAVDKIIAFCAGVPLALAIFSARAATHPQFTLGQLVAELASASHRLDCFGRTDSNNDLRAVFSWSYELLGGSAARLFRLLAIHPGPALGVATAASLMAVEARSAADLLGELGRANLLIEFEPGRFRMHDLVRAYSAELLDAVVPADERRAATCRLLDHCLHSSLAAAAHLDSHRVLDSELEPPAAGVIVERFRDFEAALSWFAKERAALLMVLEQAITLGADVHVWQLAWGMESFLRRHDFWPDLESTQLRALAAAQRLGDVPMQITSALALGHFYYEFEWNVPYKSEHHLLEAIRLCASSGDRLNQARAHMYLAALMDDVGRPADERRQYEAALSIYQELEREDPASVPPDYLAFTYMMLDAFDQALPYALRSVEYFARAGNHREATAWLTLAQVRAELQSWTECVAAIERAVTLYQAIGNEYLAGVALHQIAELLVPAGRTEQARVMLRRAVEILRPLGHPRAESAQQLLDLTEEKLTAEASTDPSVIGVR